MTSLIKFNQTVIQTVECVKYIFGLCCYERDHLKQDIKFKRVYVITRIDYSGVTQGLLKNGKSVTSAHPPL